MNNNKKKPAVIYCRVSSDKQVKEGAGLVSQEKRCRKYAEMNDLDVKAVFSDEGITGGGDFVKRTAMVNLIKFLDDHPTENYAVVFDDLKRFARDTQFHFVLRKELSVREATPLCLNFNFEDTPEGEFIETILAAQGQLERKQNRRQVCQKMKARLDSGYWTFYQPPGYEYQKSEAHGKILVPVQPMATSLAEALDLFARGVITSAAEFKRYINKHPDITPKRGNNFSNATTYRILTQILYTGYIEYPKWEVKQKKAKHQGIIDLPTYNKIQERLGINSHSSPRMDANKKFPLRGFIQCPGCGRNVTASESKGGSGKFTAYYRCNRRLSQCPLGGKSLRADKVEEDFENILQKLKPKVDLLRLTEAVFKDVWKTSDTDVEVARKDQERRLKSLDKDIIKAKEDMRRTENNLLKQEYEKDLISLLKQKQGLEEKRIESLAEEDFPKVLERSFEFIKNPLKHWDQGTFNDKRLVQKLVMTRSWVYTKNQGFGTPDVPLLYKVTTSSDDSKEDLVEVARIELASEEDVISFLRL